jgi:hypothetical protein
MHDEGRSSRRASPPVEKTHTGLIRIPVGDVGRMVLVVAELQRNRLGYTVELRGGTFWDIEITDA